MNKTHSQFWTVGIEHQSSEFIDVLSLSPYDSTLYSRLQVAITGHGLVSFFTASVKEKLQAFTMHMLSGLCKGSKGNTCQEFRHYPSARQVSRDIIIYITRCGAPEDVYHAVSTSLGYRRTLAINGSVSNSQFFHNNVPTMLGTVFQPSLRFLFTREFYSTHAYVLTMQAQSHGLLALGPTKVVADSMFTHIVSGQCLSSPSYLEGCVSILQDIAQRFNVEEYSLNPDHIKLCVLDCTISIDDLPTVMKVLHLQSLAYQHQSPNLESIREFINQYREQILRDCLLAEIVVSDNIIEQKKLTVELHQQSWPETPSECRKQSLIRNFRSATSSACLSTRTCCSCGTASLYSESEVIQPNSFNLNLLSRSSDKHVPPTFPLNHALYPYALNPEGVICNGSTYELIICAKCVKSLQQNKVPQLSYANHMSLGPIPPELVGLTTIEESLIARCRAKCMIVQLQHERRENGLSPINQKGMKGNVIIFPQHPEALPAILPPTIEDVMSYVCVVFIGSQLPEPEWFQYYATPLVVRPDRVRTALHWLKTHNDLYSDVEIDEDTLRSFPTDGSLLPFQIDHIQNNERRDATTARYEPAIVDDVDDAEPHPIPFHSVLIANVDQTMSVRELRSAAFKHLKETHGSFYAMPHDPRLVNEFDNPSLLPLTFPTMFPTAIGVVEDPKRPVAVSLANHVKHWMNMKDTRFQTHHALMFTVFNILQRRTMLLSVFLKTRRAYFQSIASSFASVSSAAVNAVAARMADSNTHTFTSTNDEEAKVVILFKQVQLVTRTVAGSNGARLQMRNNIRATIASLALPSFFVTINPADIYNPIVKFLSGNNFNIDDMVGEDIPKYWEQSCLVARNPVIAAQFFHLYMKAFIAEILAFKGIDSEHTVGALGVTKAYYGCIEAQGRGTLHCHMVVWIEGSLNPNQLKSRLLDSTQGEFKERLVHYLEDTIQNEVPPAPAHDDASDVMSDRHHPCSVRGVDAASADFATYPPRLKDLHNVVKSCQAHSHTSTCYKYWKGPPHPKECRFDLDPALVNPHTNIDPETGELHLRRLDGMVNNYNPTITEALRNNMDIKFIGSGESAKAILYYITDYISKAQLKTHVAFAALELAVLKMENCPDAFNDDVAKAKRLLQKSAYEMLGRQELSSQQVAAHLLGFKDDLASHHYRNLYWISAECFVEECMPSPECYPRAIPVQAADEGLDFMDEQDAFTEQEEYERALQSRQEEEDVHPEDVMLARDPVTGEIEARASQLQDYLRRGNLLGDVSLWDFVSRTDKVSYGDNRTLKGRGTLTGKTQADISLLEAVWEGQPNILSLHTLSRPCCTLQKEHDESNKKFLCVRHPTEAILPVPIGPPIPRRDRVDVYPRYCRIMLILFKPWRNAHHLRGQSKSWVDAFKAFRESELYTPAIDNIIVNLQVFRECKDSRDEHYRQRRLRSTTSTFPGFAEEQSASVNEVMIRMDASDATAGDGQLADYIRSWRAKRSRRDEIKDLLALECLNIAASCGIIDNPRMQDLEERVRNSIPSKPELILHVRKSIRKSKEQSRGKPNDSDMEHIWELEYQRRKKASKNPDALPQPVAATIETTIPAMPATTTGFDRTPFVQNTHRADDLASDELCARISKKWTLEHDQALCLRAISDRLDNQGRGALRGIIHGAAGTGKSRVVDSIRDLFAQRGEDYRVKVACFMGIAAQNVDGSTLHSLLNLGGISKLRAHSQPHQDMIKRWEGVDWLIIDEMSMLSLQLVFQIHEALQWCKESEKPYGGINILYVGDFAQLPPVAQTRLFAQIEPHVLCATTQGQKSTMGKILWLMCDFVIILTVPQRQAGDHNARFLELLTRLREGKCNDADYRLLNTRVLNPGYTHRLHDENSAWRDAPIIVCKNHVKDALNESRAIQFALDRGEPLHWYYASDFYQGDLVQDEESVDLLRAMDTGETKYRLGKIPLCLGMPVFVAQNFDVEGGVVNGSQGTVHSLRYILNDNAERILTSCVVTIPDVKGAPMPGLEIDQMPVLCGIVKIDWKHKWTGILKKIDRHQVAIGPAFAMTVHKSQGQSLDCVVIDLQPCTGSEAPYVMASRATSLEGLYIFRPFDKARITCAQSQDLRIEMHRLQRLDTATREQYCTSHPTHPAFHHTFTESEIPAFTNLGKRTQDQIVAFQDENYRSLLEPADEQNPRKQRRVYHVPV